MDSMHLSMYILAVSSSSYYIFATCTNIIPYVICLFRNNSVYNSLFTVRTFYFFFRHFLLFLIDGISLTPRQRIFCVFSFASFVKKKTVSTQRWQPRKKRSSDLKRIKKLMEKMWTRSSVYGWWSILSPFKECIIHLFDLKAAF